MTTEENPFATPLSDVADYTEVGNGNTITVGIVDQLKRTRPWVFLIAIVGFIFTALMGLSSLGMLFGGGAMFMGGNDLPPGTSGMFVGLAIVYLVMIVLYFILSFYLVKYASGIKKFVATGTSSDMEQALKMQASFWKIVGILTVLTLILLILSILVGIGGAMMGGVF